MKAANHYFREPIFPSPGSRRYTIQSLRKEEQLMALYLVANIVIVVVLGFAARMLWKK